MVYSSSYLYQSRHQIYYFRAIVPCQSKEGTSQYEYRRSLRTRDIVIARSRGRFLRVYVELYLEGVRYGNMEWSEFKKLLDKTLDDLLRAEKNHISSNGPYPVKAESWWRDNVIKNYKEATEMIALQRMGGHPEEPIPTYIYRLADDFLKVHQKQVPHSSPDYLKYCEAILLMQIEFCQQRLLLNEEARSFRAKLPKIEHKIHTDEQISPLISEVAEKFVAEKLKTKSWNDKTKRDNEDTYKLLMRIVNDGPILSVNYAVAQYFKEVLMSFPKNANKMPLYRGKSVDEIRAMKVPENQQLSVRRINAYLRQTSSLFNYALLNGYVEMNPFQGMKIKDNNSAQKKRLPFKDDQLQSLFSSKQYQMGKYLHPHYYWLPILGLYTGARISEVSQLYIEDVYSIDGLWVIDFNEDKDKKLKNDSSPRRVPIHSHIVKLGFIDYVNRLKKKGVDRIFPEIKRGRDGYGQYPSKWFGGYKKRCGIDEGTVRCFHSFRHNVMDFLKQKGVPVSQIQAVVGHKDESVTTGLYGTAYEPKVLVPVVEMLNFNIHVPPYKHLSK